jgi:pyruvate kinase
MGPDRPTGSRRNTKIVCTVGPASASAAGIRSLLEAGADVFRLNFSHSDHDWHASVLRTIREVSDQLGRPTAVIQDLCGPKIRLSHVPQENYRVESGQTVRITTEAIRASWSKGAESLEFELATNYAALIDDVAVGDTILVNEGRVLLDVDGNEGGVITARVRRGGPLSVGKGINLPGISLSTESMTAKDWADLDWGIIHKVDFVALSFVRRPDDLAAVRQHLKDAGSRSRLIAKIERPEALGHLSEIIELADGLMVARGDLGLETELARVPLLQKQIIEACRRAGKPVITATQMLESMITEPTPTRAEVSDVANAIFDGTDAIMLSAETATGAFPDQAVAVLDRVAEVTEIEAHRSRVPLRAAQAKSTLASAIVSSATSAALNLACDRVVVYSQSGLTARLMATSRLPMPIVAVTNQPATYHQLSLSYGVHPVLMPDVVDLTQLLGEMDSLAQREGWGQSGDVLVVVSALDGRDGNIDTLHIHRIRS